MFDLGWTELLVIGIVALIVVGPKDLPVLFRKLGEFTGKARAMAREFTSAMNQAADEAGVKDVTKDLRNIANPSKMGLDAVKDAAGDISGLTDIDKPYSASRQTLSPERAEAKAKIEAAAAKAATERKAAEAEAEAADAMQEEPAQPAKGDSAT